MKITSLKINAEIEYLGLNFTILSIDPPTITLIRKGGAADPIIVHFFDLIQSPTFMPSKHLINKIEKEHKDYYSLLDNLKENKREQLSKRFEIIRPILVLEKLKQGLFTAFIEFLENHNHYLKPEEKPEGITQDELLERISLNHKMSKRSLQRYLKNYRTMEVNNPNKGEEGLISRAGEGYKYRKDNRLIELCHPKFPDLVIHTIQTRLCEKYIPIIKEVIEKEYLNLQRKSKTKIYELISIKCVKEDIEKPKAVTIYKMLDRIPKQVVDRLRHGNKASENYLEIKRGYANEEALYPLHVVEIDHTRLDIDIIDEKSGLVIGRPWITLGVDVYTRMVWCLHISFEPPSANKVRKAVEQGILFKGSKEKYGTLKEWEMFGIPKNIVLDNGKEFDNVETRRIINEVLKSNVRYRPVGTPRYGGTIERLFRTLNMKLIHQLEGTRKSNVNDLGEYDAEKNALLSLEDLNEILIRFITDIYHYEEHRGLPLECNAPIVRYYEGLKISGIPDFIEEEEIEEFKIDLLPKILKPYTRDGIRINNIFYRSSELSYLINKREVKYTVKYDIDDISYIYIKKPDSPEYVKVMASSPSYEVLRGINQFTYNLLVKSLREEGKEKRGKILSDQQLLQAKAKLQEDLETKYKKGRKVRQQASRMNLEVELKQTMPVNKKITYEEILENARKAFKEA